jgi:dTDP-4-amino-4,6-dideoxygalactose transaminase
MNSNGIGCIFHYVPLHNSSYGKKIGRVSGELKVTEGYADRLVRLPLWLGLGSMQEEVIDQIHRRIYAI